MSFSTLSFLAWAFFMLALIVGLIVSVRRGRNIETEAEDVASKALPEIGKIAEKKHKEKFGRPATSPESWYPEDRRRGGKIVRLHR